MTTRLEQLEAALKISEARVEQVEASRKVSDAKVELVESQLRSSEAKIEELNAKYKASEAQLGQFKTYLRASDKKVKKLEDDILKLKLEFQTLHNEKQLNTEDKVCILKEENEKIVQDMSSWNRELSKAKTQFDKHVKETRSNYSRMRKQTLLGCQEMEQVRKKFTSLQPQTPSQQSKGKKFNFQLRNASNSKLRTVQSEIVCLRRVVCSKLLALYRFF